MRYVRGICAADSTRLLLLLLPQRVLSSGILRRGMVCDLIAVGRFALMLLLRGVQIISSPPNPKALAQVINNPVLVRCSQECLFNAYLNMYLRFPARNPCRRICQTRWRARNNTCWRFRHGVPHTRAWHADENVAILANLWYLFFCALLMPKLVVTACRRRRRRWRRRRR